MEKKGVKLKVKYLKKRKDFLFNRISIKNFHVTNFF